MMPKKAMKITIRTTGIDSTTRSIRNAKNRRVSTPWNSSGWAQGSKAWGRKLAEPSLRQAPLLELFKPLSDMTGPLAASQPSKWISPKPAARMDHRANQHHPSVRAGIVGRQRSTGAHSVSTAVWPERRGGGAALFLSPTLFRGLRRKIPQHPVGAGALDPDQAFHHRPLAVDPAVGGSPCDHGVFARHLVGEGRHREGILDAPQHVEIGHALLHHHHVGTLGD